MQINYQVGKMYLVTREQAPYVRKGAIVVFVGQNRWAVKWEDGVSEWVRRGDRTLVGYDPIARTYTLHLFNEFIVEIPSEQDETRLAEIKEAIADGDNISADDMRWYASQTGEWVADYVHCQDSGEYVMRQGAYHCPVGDCWYSSESEFTRAYDRHGDEISAHVENLDDSSEYFQCGRNGEYYSRRCYTCVYVADQDEYWCLDENDFDLTFCDVDNNYYFDEDNVPRSSRIPSYHSQQRERRWQIPDGITLGVELEVYLDEPDEAYANRASEIIGERDGSLCRVHGVEFIGAPMNYEDYFKPRNPWAVTLEAINDAGVGVDPHHDRIDGYGIHISVGRRALCSEVQARFVLFINNCQDFSEFIAQRGQNRWAYYDKKDVTHVSQSFTSSGEGQWGSKYSATHIAEERIEVRIFKSVTKPELFQKNVDYVYSALMFCTEHEDVADVISVEKYLSWLSEQEGYSALKAFIGDNGSRFTEADKRKVLLKQHGFIIEESDNDSVI